VITGSCSAWRELEKERLVSGSDVITDRSVYQMEIEKATHHDNPI
jgi:hypothetical protein